jgi:flagellar biosynthesis/type III secretory pathway protein FliH
MASVALTDRAAVLTAVEGARIPRRAWSCMAELAQLLAQASEIVRAAELQAEEVRRKAHAEGFATGVAQAQIKMTEQVLEAQRAAREFAAASEQRVVALALSVVERIAPALGEASLVAALAAEALRGVQSERHLRLYVTPAAEEATRRLAVHWQREHPEIESVQVSADPNLQPFCCVVESEQGRIEAGLGAQLEAVRDILMSVAGRTHP